MGKHYKVISGRNGLFLEFDNNVTKAEQELIIMKFAEMLRDNQPIECDYSELQEEYSMLEEVIKA